MPRVARKSVSPTSAAARVARRIASVLDGPRPAAGPARRDRSDGTVHVVENVSVEVDGADVEARGRDAHAQVVRGRDRARKAGLHPGWVEMRAAAPADHLEHARTGDVLARGVGALVEVLVARQRQADASGLQTRPEVGTQPAA